MIAGPDPAAAGSGHAASRSAVLSVLCDLTVHHGQLRAVADLSLDVSEGEIFAIIGANGAGKSTLLRTIAGLHRPTTGTISLDGADLTHAEPEDRLVAGIALFPRDAACSHRSASRRT